MIEAIIQQLLLLIIAACLAYFFIFVHQKWKKQDDIDKKYGIYFFMKLSNLELRKKILDVSGEFQDYPLIKERVESLFILTSNKTSLDIDKLKVKRESLFKVINNSNILHERIEYSEELSRCYREGSEEFKEFVEDVHSTKDEMLMKLFPYKIKWYGFLDIIDRYIIAPVLLVYIKTMIRILKDKEQNDFYDKDKINTSLKNNDDFDQFGYSY